MDYSNFLLKEESFKKYIKKSIINKEKNIKNELLEEKEQLKQKMKEIDNKLNQFKKKKNKQINNLINDFSNTTIEDKRKIDYNKLTFVELFCGLGVFHISINNIIKDNECLLSCDILDEVKKIYQLNFNQIPEYDVLQINLDKYKKIDMIVGSPPCQSFSVAGKKLGLEDIRGELFFHMLDLIKKYQPKYSIIENVKGILKNTKGLVLKMIIEKCEEMGYYMKYFLTNPKMINIPQNRDRVYFILIRKDLTDENIINKLEQNYNVLIEKYKEKNNNLIILDNNLIEDLPEKIKIPIELFNELILQLPNEKQNIDLNYIWYNENIKKINNITYEKMKYLYLKYKEIFNNFYNKNKTILDTLPKTKKILEWNTGTKFCNIWDFNIQYRQSGIRVKDINKYPCLTKSGQRLIIGKEKRFISIKECSRLQSFKNDYIFLDDDIKNYQMLGNSINIQITTLIIDTLFTSLNDKNIYNYSNIQIKENKIIDLNIIENQNNEINNSIKILISSIKKYTSF
jgi:DNA (cytosine-5)-methyltransferase 1